MYKHQKALESGRKEIMARIGSDHAGQVRKEQAVCERGISVDTYGLEGSAFAGSL